MHFKSIGLVVLISLIGVFCFNLAGLPVPWMLGPLFAVLISQFLIKYELYWPVKFRNFGLIIVGISIGQAFQMNLLAGAGWLVTFMLLLNIVLVIISIFMALGIQKIGNISLKTALTCTVPGGLAQITVFAEEEKDIDLAVVVFFHVVRIISIVFLVPFFLSGHIIQASGGDSLELGSIIPIILLIIVSYVSAIVGLKLKIPVSFFLSPVLLLVILNVCSIDTPELPSILLHIAQLFMGAYIGLQLKPEMLKLGKRVLILGIGSALFLLAVTFGQALLLKYFLHYSLATSFLSTAAGGLDQMSLLATAVGADVSVVTVFQMFRLLFVFLVVLPLLKVACSMIDKKNDISIVKS
ncbi:AbrB family transcriptional regulator [Lysinibacillus endophyticus]|uniref:AbrB family transcriptional regulator n=1 Tax=Ureibacillus endophyticus TaxID=1978490 RepID=UPI0031356A5A